MTEKQLKQIGTITHYFTKISVAVIQLTNTIKVGDTILIQGPTTNLEQTVESMQIEHENVQTAKQNQSIGLKVNQRVREGDIVYKIIQ